ncbi:MAG: hypothetical protein Q7U78_00975 [Gallionella sp.]|nr:hypothetical protein [Gallionella sp.]
MKIMVNQKATVNLEAEMHYVSSVFTKCYATSASIDGAHQRTDEKIRDFYRGVKNRRNDFISTEAIIHATAIHRRISFEEANAHHFNKSEDALVNTISAHAERIGGQRYAFAHPTIINERKSS